MDEPTTTATPVADSSGSAAPTTPAGTPPAAPATAPTPAGAGDAPAKPSTNEPPEGNAFIKAAKGFSGKLQERLEQAEKDAATPGQPGRDPAKAAAAPKAPETKPGEPAKAPEPKAETPKGDDGAPAPLTFVGKDGKPVPFQWPEGAVIRFKGSGQQQVVDTPAKALELMQKGADYGRATARLGEERAQAQTALKAAQEASQKMLLAVLFGDGEQSAEEVREALQPTLEKFLDPEYRKGQDAMAREAARQQAERSQGEQDVTEYTQSVYSDAEDYIGGRLDRYEFLEASDTPIVQRAMHAEYEAQFNAKLQELLPDLRANRLAPEEVQELAEQHARAVFNTATLDALMDRLNGEYKRRLNAKGGAKPPAPASGPTADDPAAASAAITAHNARTDQKLEQQERTRSLRGAGTPPAAAPVAPDTSAMTFDERRRFNSSRLRRLGA